MSRPVAVAVGAVLLCVVALQVWSCNLDRRIINRAAAAEEACRRAEAEAAKAKVFDAQEQAWVKRLESDAASVDALRAELAALRRRIHTPVPTPVVDPPQVAMPVQPADLTPVVQKQDELIKALDQQVEGLRAQLVTVTSSRDSWRSAFEERSKEADLLRVALKAQADAAKAARWRGRIEGFAVGAALGYVGGTAK